MTWTIFGVWAGWVALAAPPAGALVCAGLLNLYDRRVDTRPNRSPHRNTPTHQHTNTRTQENMR